MPSLNEEERNPASPSTPDINAFVLKEGRLPRLGDLVAPWQYRGWLLFQVQLADPHPALPGRWTHYQRTLEAGRLLAEPIPNIHFSEFGGTQGRKLIEQCLRLVEARDSSWNSFNRFIEWLAWGLAVAGEEPQITAPVQEQLYRTFDLEPILTEPHDYLGSHLAERRSNGWNPNAFYPTPHGIVEMMVCMTFVGSDQNLPDENSRDPRLQTVLDPCVGTGRMLLHASNYSYCLYGMDIDPLVVMITKINGALYAPWLAFPFPERILGVPLPPPPPAKLPVPEHQRRDDDAPSYRVDDHGQGLLFG